MAQDATDMKVMDDMGLFFAMNGAAEKWQLDSDARRLDFTLDNNVPDNAADLSRQACRHYLNINNTKLSEEWTVRVYLLNGEVGAQCHIAKMR
jgi:hypothetical protein